VAKTVANRKAKSLDEIIARSMRDQGFSAKEIGEAIKRLDDPNVVRNILIGQGKDKRLNPEPSTPVKPEGREGRGQGKVKKKGGMRKATAKGDATRIGQVAIKRAWAAARASVGEDRWKVMTKEQKTVETLKRVGKMTGEEAIGASRALGSRVLPLAGSNAEVEKIIEGWAKGQGVKAPKTEMKIGAKGKAEGKGGKEIARAGGKGAEAAAGPEKPALGKKAKRIVRRRTRLDELLIRGEGEDQTRRELAQEKEKRMSGDKADAPKVDPLPEGVKDRRISVAGKKYVLPVKGNKVYIQTQSGKWRTVTLKQYTDSIASGLDPSPKDKSKKPASVKQAFGKKMETLTVAGKSLNAEYITESAAQAFIDANRKISEKNKIAIGKGTPTDKLAPRYTVAQFVETAYPNLGRVERSSLINGIRKSFRGERKARKAARASQSGKVTVLRPETVEEGRKKASAKDVRLAKGRAAPLEKVELESKAGARRRLRREKNVGQVIAAVMDPKKSTPSAESMEPAPKRAKRKFVAPKPGSEMEANFAKLRESLSPAEKGTLRKIKETSRVGFTKDQVKKMATAGTFGRITPKVRKVAKAGGYLGLVAAALKFLEEPNKRKN
jgi:hypothetical protein